MMEEAYCRCEGEHRQRQLEGPRLNRAMGRGGSEKVRQKRGSKERTWEPGEPRGQEKSHEGARRPRGGLAESAGLSRKREAGKGSKAQGCRVRVGVRYASRGDSVTGTCE